MMYMKAVEAGADIIDTAISTLALGTSQPATETMVATFAGTPFPEFVSWRGMRALKPA
jgi:oxaloacetate decarboxylase alpha subunit